MKPKPNWRHQYQWQVGGNQQVKKVLQAIRPYTALKSSQIDATMELLSTFGKPGYMGKKMISADVVTQRQSLVRQIKRLKHLEVLDEVVQAS